MIVKDEEHVIANVLRDIKPHIDCYLICDTGSTDATKSVIISELEGIPGRIIDEPFKDFSYNRNVALREAKKMDCQYIWIIDADDRIHGNFVRPKKMDADSYLLKFSGGGAVYYRTQILRASEEFKYVGVLHEYVKCTSKKRPISKKITGDYHIESGRTGARSKDPKKYEKDAELLLKGLQDEPNNERYMFYLAQSYMDALNFREAIKWYNKRIEMGKWYEEVYYSRYKIAQMKEMLNDPWPEVEETYLQAFKDSNYKRAEPLYRIAVHYIKVASKIPRDPSQILFVEDHVYQKISELSDSMN